MAGTRSRCKSMPIRPRECSQCHKRMYKGFCIGNGDSYYCSQPCLKQNMTWKEYIELHDEGRGDSYWSEWTKDD